MTATPEARAFLGVGSNIEPRRNVEAALEILDAIPGVTLTGISTFYRTDPLPPPGDRTECPEGTFLNGVIEIQTGMGVGELEATLRAVESRLGRIRTRDPFDSRTLDLDLLLFLSAGERSSRPVHPDVCARAFVAVPLLELAPDLLLPPHGRSLREVANRFDGPGGEPDVELTNQLRSRFLLASGP